MSDTSSLTSKEDYVTSGFSFEDGKIGYTLYNTFYRLQDIGEIPVYHVFTRSSFLAPSARGAAYGELARVTQLLIDSPIRVRGSGDCFKHSGLDFGTISLPASKGVPVRFPNGADIRGRIRGYDSYYGGFLQVSSSPTDSIVHLQPNTNYVIHGDDVAEEIEVLKSNTYLNRISGCEIMGIDIEAGKNLLFKGSKFLWYVNKCVTETSDTRMRVVIVPECCDHIRIPISMFFRNVYAVRKAIKAISLSRKMRVPFDYITLAEMSREGQETIAAVLARVAGTLEIHGRAVCLLGMRSKPDSPNFPNPIETSLAECKCLVSRTGETGLLHRTLGNARVSTQGDIGHIDEGDNRIKVDFDRRMRWAGETVRWE